MFTIPSTLNTHMQGDVASLAYAVKITTTGGVTLRFTTAPVDCTLGGVVYSASMAVTVASIVSSLGLTAGKVDINGFFDPAGITEEAIHAGIYDFADVEIYCFNWADVSMGSWTPLKGKVSDITIDGRQWVLEVSDLLDLLSQSVVEITSATCRAELFDTRCGLPTAPPVWTAATAYTLASPYDVKVGSWVQPSTPNRLWYTAAVSGTSGGAEPTWNTTVETITTDNGLGLWFARNAFVQTGSVTAKTSNKVFADSSITEQTNFWQYGKIVWLTGSNVGTSIEIKSQTATVLELFLDPPYTVEVGDTFTIYAGCSKTVAGCQSHANIYNMRAEPLKPSSKLLRTFGQR